jgi:hypothetical protein
VMKVREGCIWDITEAGADLTAAYLVRVEQGTVAGLRLDVPPELEVMRVAARSLEVPAASIPLRDWSLAAEKGGARLLRIDFQNPASGRLLVVVQCSPRKPITRQPVLRFPRVNFGGTTGETEAVYGLRSSRVTLDNVGLKGVTDFPPDALKDFANVPDLRLDPNTPVRAFRPSANGRGELRPVIRVVEPPVVRIETAWQVGPHRADATGRVSWIAKEPLPLVEFTLPGVKVVEIRGADVAAWNQSGSRVQVWLRSAVREGEIEWTGGMVPTPPGKPHPNPLPVELAHPRVTGARHDRNEIRVRPIDGWHVDVDRSRGWQTLPNPRGELHFRTDLPNPPDIRLRLTPAAHNGR